MDTPTTIVPPAAAPGMPAEGASQSAPRNQCGLKVVQSVVASDRAFTREWAARRALAAIAGKPQLFV